MIVWLEELTKSEAQQVPWSAGGLVYDQSLYLYGSFEPQQPTNERMHTMEGNERQQDSIKENGRKKELGQIKKSDEESNKNRKRGRIDCRLQK